VSSKLPKEFGPVRRWLIERWLNALGFLLPEVGSWYVNIEYDAPGSSLALLIEDRARRSRSPRPRPGPH